MTTAEKICHDIDATRSRLSLLYEGASVRETVLLDLVDDLMRQCFAAAAAMVADERRTP